MVTDRRRLLSTLAGALGLALAGCSTRTGRTGTTTQSSTATTGASTTATRAGNTTTTEPATTRTTTTESATTEPTVAIEGPDGPVVLEEDERTMVRLDLAASGGTIEEVS